MLQFTIVQLNVLCVLMDYRGSSQPSRCLGLSEPLQSSSLSCCGSPRDVTWSRSEAAGPHFWVQWSTDLNLTLFKGKCWQKNLSCTRTSLKKHYILNIFSLFCYLLNWVSWHWLFFAFTLNAILKASAFEPAWLHILNIFKRVSPLKFCFLNPF